MLTQKTLIQRLQDNPNEKAWDEFVHYYSGYIYVIIRNMNISHHDAQDLRQQALVKTWKGLPNFVYEPEKSRFRSWLCTVVKNTVRSFLASKTRKLETMTAVERQEVGEYLAGIVLPDIERIAEEEWEHYVANLAMVRVAERFQPQVLKAFELFCDGMGGNEVADELGLPLNTVHVYKKRVQSALYKEIALLEYDLN